MHLLYPHLSSFLVTFCCRSPRASTCHSRTPKTCKLPPSPLALYETVALFCLAFREKEIRCKKREGGGEQKAKQRIFWPAASTRGAALPTSEVRERTAVTPPPTPVPGPGRRAKEQTRSNGFPGSQPPPLFSCPVAFVRRERRLSNAGLGRWPPLLPAREPERLHVRADDRPRSSKIVCYESARSFEAPASRRSLAHRLIRRLLCTSAKLSSALRQSSSCNVFCTYVKPIRLLRATHSVVCESVKVLHIG